MFLKAVAVANTTLTPDVTFSSMISNASSDQQVATCTPGSCQFGLINDMQVGKICQLQDSIQYVYERK